MNTIGKVIGILLMVGGLVIVPLLNGVFGIDVAILGAIMLYGGLIIERLDPPDDEFELDPSATRAASPITPAELAKATQSDLRAKRKREEAIARRRKRSADGAE